MSEWEEICLRDITKSANTGLDAIKRAPIVENDTGIKCLRIQDISQSKKIEEWGFCDVTEANYKKFQLRAGEIIMARTCSTGVHYLVPQDLAAVFNNGLVRIRADETKCLSKYLSYCFSTYKFKGYIKGISGGTSVQLNMQIGDLLDYPLLLPTVKEQHKVVSVLSSLDRKIENLRNQNETLEKIAQTLFKQWFIDFEFPNADGKPYKSSGGEMMPSELGEIPAGWRVGKLGDFCTIFRGSSPRPITSPVFFKDGTIPWIKIADATKSGSIYLSETKEFCTEAALPHTRLLKKGSLILSNSATVGIPMILNLEGCIHDGWLSFKNYQIITRNFLFFVLTNKLKFLTKYADGTVQKNLNTGILKDMDFVIPENDLIDEFTTIAQALFDKILVNEQQIQTLTQTRDTLLPKLMSGQLRIGGY